jgi:hypothetical protein
MSYSIWLSVLAGLLSFSACSSAPKPRSLNLNTITGNVPVYSVSLLIRKDIDENGKGKDFIRSFFTKNAGTIKQMLADRGVNIDENSFLNDFNGDPNIELDVMEISPSFVVHRYYWNAKAPSETRAELLLNFVILEDGTMPLEVTVKKDDPEYEPGYSAKITLSLKFEEG